MSVTYKLSTVDLEDTTITDGNNNVLYWIETEHSKKPKTTHIYKATPEGKLIVFSVDFSGTMGGSEQVEFSLEGRTATIKETFPKHSLAPRHRDMPTPIGEFNWARTGGLRPAVVTLRDPRKATVVEYNRNGLRNPSPTLTVSGTALSLPLDTIILGLFVMRHDDLNARKRGKAIANIISAGAGGGPF